jgi:hypothetical protein
MVIDRTAINLNPYRDGDNDCENSDTDSQSDCENSEIDNAYSNTRPGEDTDMVPAQLLYSK